MVKLTTTLYSHWIIIIIYHSSRQMSTQNSCKSCSIADLGSFRNCLWKEQNWWISSITEAGSCVAKTRGKEPCLSRSSAHSEAHKSSQKSLHTHTHTHTYTHTHTHTHTHTYVLCELVVVVRYHWQQSCHQPQRERSTLASFETPASVPAWMALTLLLYFFAKFHKCDLTAHALVRTHTHMYAPILTHLSIYLSQFIHCYQSICQSYLI